MTASWSLSRLPPLATEPITNLPALVSTTARSSWYQHQPPLSLNWMMSLAAIVVVGKLGQAAGPPPLLLPPAPPLLFTPPLLVPPVVATPPVVPAPAVLTGPEPPETPPVPLPGIVALPPVVAGTPPVVAGAPPLALPPLGA